MTSLGTLFAFAIVAIGVLVLRFTEPKIHRSFKCPAVYIVVPLAVLSCGYLIYTLLLQTGFWFMMWSILGLIIYFTYGYHHSPLNRKNKKN